ncbi:MAG: hypothetical protein JXB32_07400 [Deltaproteobacteria bacterium]|nr:hypothetical protein [Deltaproteobacteria bacterium]
MEREVRAGGATTTCAGAPATARSGAAAPLGVLAAAALLACGPASAPVAVSPEDPSALPDDAVVARFGCTAITAGDVRRWQRVALAAEPLAGPPGGGPTAPRGFDAARNDLLNRAVVARVAARLGLHVEETEVGLALLRLAAQGGRTVEQFLTAARDRGLTPAELREVVAADLLRFSLLVGVMVGEGWPRHEDVVAECRRRFGDGGCTAEQASVVRDDLRQALTPQWISTRGAEWLAERRAELEALVVEEGPEGCVEREAEPTDVPDAALPGR